MFVRHLHDSRRGEVALVSARCSLLERHEIVATHEPQVFDAGELRNGEDRLRWLSPTEVGV
jgi:hypothetical protein